MKKIAYKPVQARSPRLWLVTLSYLDGYVSQVTQQTIPAPSKEKAEHQMLRDNRATIPTGAHHITVDALSLQS